MRKLSSIQDTVRVHIGDTLFTIISDANKKHMGLKMANQIYRKLASLYKFPELTRIDTSLTTTGGTSTYTWVSTPNFLDIVSIEMKNGEGEYEIIPPVRDELDWSHFSRKSNSFPSVYRFASTTVEKQIAFAPTPDSSKNIRITGGIEPDDLVSEESETVFMAKAVDDAFEYLIAAERSFKQNFASKAEFFIKKASSLMTTYTGKEIPPQEIDPRVGA